MTKKKSEKVFTICRKCDRWGGYAVRKENQAGKKFLCLDPDAPNGMRKRADGSCWRLAAPAPEELPAVNPAPETYKRKGRPTERRPTVAPTFDENGLRTQSIFDRDDCDWIGDAINAAKAKNWDEPVKAAT